MKMSHLTEREQEECVIDRPAPHLLQHLTECPGCRAAVERLQHGVATYRDAAKEWGSANLATRTQWLPTPAQRRRALGLRWALAAVVPVVLLLLLLLPFHLTPARPAQPVSALSDDALLEQVDEQLSTAVPSSMESLTHLVSTESGNGADADTPGGKPIVRTN